MSNQEDLEFGKMALARGMVQPQQLAKCLQVRQSKTNTSLGQIMLDEGFLKSNQHAVILQELQSVKRQFGRYKILEEIGRGGMGRVYKALDTQLDRIVALKVLLSEERESDVERFLREAKATAELQHPNIICLHDIGRDEGQNYFTMDFIDGKSLQEYRETAKLTFKKIATLMAKVAKAIHYAHQKGIIHRDMKPANIMITAKGEPIVMDFGLAKVAGASKKLSMSGMLLGTMYYMPPEQTTGRTKAVDARSDIYAMGVILYELITGQLPFKGQTITEMVQQIVNKEPQAPNKINPEIPAPCTAICLKAIAKKKEERYQDAQQFAEDLLRFANDQPISIKLPGFFDHLAKKLRRKSTIAVVAVVLIAVLAYSFLGSKKNISVIIEEFSATINAENPDNTFTSQQGIELKISHKINASQNIAKQLTLYGQGLKVYHLNFAAENFQSQHQLTMPVTIKNLQQEQFTANVLLAVGKKIEQREIQFVINYPKSANVHLLRKVGDYDKKIQSFLTAEKPEIDLQQQAMEAIVAIVKLLTNKTPITRFTAAQVILSHKNKIDVLLKNLPSKRQKQTIDILKKALQLKSSKVQHAALEVLAHTGTQSVSALSSLYKIIDQNKDDNIRIHSIKTLAKILHKESPYRGLISNKHITSGINFLIRKTYSEKQLEIVTHVLEALNAISTD